MEIQPLGCNFGVLGGLVGGAPGRAALSGMGRRGALNAYDTRNLGDQYSNDNIESYDEY